MVNFNNESTITTAPQDIVKIMILERRKYVCDNFEHYYKQHSNGINPNISLIKSSMVALFYEIQASLKRDSEEYDNIKQIIFNGTKIEDFMNSFELLNIWLDKKKLTRVDNIKNYDSTNIEIENKEKGV